VAGHLLAPLTCSLLLLVGCTGSSPGEPADGTPEQPPCERGALDGGYCDRDGDMIADLPGPDGLQDPRTLIFSYTPVEDPAVYAKVWDGFIAHLSEVTGKPVRFFPVQSYAAQYEAMRAGRLHIAGVNTGGTPVAVNCAGFAPFAMMAAADGSYGYEMEIITWPGSGITTPADLKGKTMAFTSPTSNSGFKAPSALLKGEFGLEADTDFTAVYSGKHDNSVMGVANKDYDAAAIANTILERMVEREVVAAGAVTSIYKSETFPTTAYGLAHNLDPALAAKIHEAFFSFDWEGSALKAEFTKEDQFIAIDYKKDWALIRRIDETNEVSYACR
jgi:phosphonate transport system substrate-binding protein